MLDFLERAFRSEPDGWSLKLMSLPHIIIMALVFSLAVVVWIKRNYFEKHDILRKPLAVALLLQFTILYAWYFFGGYTGIRESLPLYNCRFAIICCTFALLSKNKLLQLITCYWGLSGGILAVLLPSMDPFSWPHYTQISFLVGHLALLSSVIYIITIDKPEFNQLTLKKMLLFTTGYHTIVAMVDYALSTNYCFLRNFPFGELPFVANHTIGYTLFAIFVHNFIVILSHMGLKELSGFRSKVAREEHIQEFHP